MKAAKCVVMVGSGVVKIPPKLGGAVELIINETAKHVAKNFNVYVLDRKDNDAEHELRDGVNFKRLGASRFGNKYLLRLTELIFGIRSLLVAREISKKDPVGVVHAHTVFTALPLALMKRFLPGGTKLVYTCHNPAWSNDAPDFLNRAVMRIEGCVMRRCDTVTTVSNFMRECITDKANVDHDKIKTVYNFADSKFSSKHGKSWKKRAGIDGKMVLFVSKLIPNKGVEQLIRAAEIVARSDKGVKFVLAGPVSFEYEGKNKWAELAKSLGVGNNVLFAGALDENELPLAYSSADLFCFPTKQESFGMVIVEAMASGLPVVTTDLPVTREVAGDAAVYAKKGDYTGLAEKIVALLRDEKKLAKLSNASLMRAQKFRKENVLKGYDEIYSEFCK